MSYFTFLLEENSLLVESQILASTWVFLVGMGISFFMRLGSISDSMIAELIIAMDRSFLEMGLRLSNLESVN